METLTKSGDISAFGYACGHVKRQEKGGNYKELYREHNAFHVKAGVIDGKRFLWEIFDTLTEARKYFISLK